MPGPHGTVLVLTSRFDPTADRVVEELNRRGVPVFRADAAEFPSSLTLAARLDGGRRTVELTDIAAVYYRRPSRFQLPDLPPAIQDIAAAEARIGFGGVIAALDCRWLPHPARAADAAYKPLQLRVAAESGLSVPRTLVTNDPVAARRFADELTGPPLYKPFNPMRGTVAGGSAAGYASLVDPADLPHPDIATTAHQFQEVGRQGARGAADRGRSPDVRRRDPRQVRDGPAGLESGLRPSRVPRHRGTGRDGCRGTAAARLVRPEFRRARLRGHPGR